MKIGNWEIDTEKKEIIWKGKGKSKIVLANDNFFGLTNPESFTREILSICEKTNIDDSDVFALNSTLIYAIEKFDIIVPDGFYFSRLIEEQIKIILEKDDYPDEIVL